MNKKLINLRREASLGLISTTTQTTENCGTDFLLHKVP